MVADIITLSRVLFSLLLLVFSPFSFPFTALYLLCGATDVLDGFAARKLHTESEHGAMLDSVTDLLFAVIYAVKILPLLSIPFWIWIWTTIIAVIKLTGIIIASKKARRLQIEHSFGNKLAGLLLFLLPLSIYIADVKYGAALVCIAATVTTIKEILKICGGNNMENLNEEKNEELEEQQKKDKEDAQGNYMAIGMCLGMSIGTAIGAAMGNISLGMSLGLCFGMIVGIAIKKK